MKVQTLHHKLDWQYFLDYVKVINYVKRWFLLTLPERTAGAKICKAVINEFCSRQIEISEVVYVTTNGVPSITGEKAGFASLFSKEFGQAIISFHCIIRVRRHYVQKQT